MVTEYNLICYNQTQWKHWHYSQIHEMRKVCVMMSEEGKDDLQGIPSQEQTTPQAEMQPATPSDPVLSNPAASDPIASDKTANDLVASDTIARKKKRTMIILLSTLIPVGAIIIAAVLVLVLMILPEMDRANRYDAGMKAYQSGSYSTAVEAFAKLPAYKESAKYHELAAVYVLKQDGKYAEAKAEFTRLGLNDMATECDYLAALDLEKAGKNKEAYDAYLALKDYKDCTPRATAICDNVIAQLLTKVKEIKAPTTLDEFATDIQSMEDVKAEATKFGAIGRVAGPINTKTDEIMPAYAKLYFDQVLAGKTTNNTTYIVKFGMTSSTNWGKLKKLVTQRFDVCPDVLANYHKVTAAIKNKPLIFRYYAVTYNATTKAYDKETLVDESGTQKASNAGEWVMPNQLKGTFKGEDFDFRYLYPNGIYRAEIVIEDTNEIIASVYFTIGIK